MKTNSVECPYCKMGLIEKSLLTDTVFVQCKFCERKYRITKGGRAKEVIPASQIKYLQHLGNV